MGMNFTKTQKKIKNITLAMQLFFCFVRLLNMQVESVEICMYCI